ncbi:MAG TPA: amino acid permease [Thermoanaerobaculia bacterium]|jgi:APA family basic amino acid/polyamine antiporter|nr:amino acid permease [Thermoanaerobaculia bacterium]
MSTPAATPRPAAAPHVEPELSRGLNLWDSTLVVLGLVLGGGIFLTPASIAKAIPSTTAILAAWIVGGLLSVIGGFVYAEMGAMFPRAGGMYLYFREAFGELPAFLYVWLAYWVIQAGANAAVAVGFATYFSVFFPGLSTSRIVANVGPLPISAGQLVAVVLILALSATHYIGVRRGVRIQGLFTLLIVLALLWLSVGGLVATPSAPAAGTAVAATPASPLPVTPAGFGIAMIGVFWCFYGWSDIVAVAGEVKRPERNLPLALMAGTGLILLLYVTVNFVFLRAIPAAELATVEQPAALAAERLFGAGSKVVISFAVTAAAAGCVSAGLLLGPRVVYALSKDGLFPKAFGRVHPRFRTPGFAIVIQAIWTSLLCFSGRYDQLYTYSIFAVILAYAGTGVALLIFRRRLPDLPRPYRCSGYPIVPIVFVVTSLALAANTIREQPRETLTGVGILLLGLPVYFWMRRRLSNAPAESR